MLKLDGKVDEIKLLTLTLTCDIASDIDADPASGDAEWRSDTLIDISEILIEILNRTPDMSLRSKLNHFVETIRIYEGGLSSDEIRLRMI